MLQHEYGWTTQYISETVTVKQAGLWADKIERRTARESLRFLHSMSIAYAASMSREGQEAFQAYAAELERLAGYERKAEELLPDRITKLPDNTPLEHSEPNPVIIDALRQAGRWDDERNRIKE